MLDLKFDYKLECKQIILYLLSLQLGLGASNLGTFDVQMLKFNLFSRI